ncbi:MAG: TIGR02680 family protein [Trueperaceae bacterium]|nr:MAG: TIGR02680 family protein [Trueperaceae bacterium]
MLDAPAPTSTRWQPLRLGLVDLYFYDDEVFPFVDGRLLLRGNNGTGKSKVLALTLPFLLDGDLSARRIEPDADPNKRMEWNLLLGGAHPHSERLGYTWIEFGRLGDDGERVYCTLGAGLKAAQGRGMLRHWFFVTDRRVSDELALLDASRTALSRERLVEALGDRGRVYDVARDYRRAVDERLFGLGEQRYGALVDLLVQLRQPQLSKRPNERALSDALTQSLSPVQSELIEYVAEAFRSLDDERQQLEELADATRAAEAFLEHYRRYARVIVRRRADGPRTTHSRYEELGRELVRIRDELAAARAALVGARAELERLDRRATVLQAELEALMESEHVEGEAQLIAAEREAEAARARTTEAQVRLERAEHDAARYEAVRAAAQASAEEAAAVQHEASAAAAAAADDAGLRDGHAEVEADPPEPLADTRRRADDLLTRRRRALARVRELVVASEGAARALAAAGSRLDDATSILDRAGERAAEAERARSDIADRLAADTSGHVATLVETRVDDPAALADEVLAWTATLDGPNPAATALHERAERARGAIAEARAQAQARRSELVTREAQLDDEIAALEGGRSDGPPARHTRTGDDVRGLPLWRCVDFLADVPADERAGWEAALEASGLLDAHVVPGGNLVAAHDGELLLTQSASPAAPATLAAVLRPQLPPDESVAPVGRVLDEDVTAALRSIAIATVSGAAEPDAASWVAADGRFRLGVTTGAWSKPEATYVGEGAREVARRRRITEARAEREVLQREQAEVMAAIEHLDTRAVRVRDEVERLPSDRGLQAAHATLTAAERAVDDAVADRGEAEAAVASAATVAEAHVAELGEVAGALQLPATSPELDTVRDAVDTYERRLGQLWHATELALLADRRLADAHSEHERAVARFAEAEHARRQRIDEFAAARARFETLESTIGADVREFRRRRTEVAAARKEADTQRERSRRAESDAERDEAVAEERERSLLEQQADAAAERARAVAALRRTAALGLLAVALPAVEVPDPSTEWAPAAAIALARSVEAELASVAADDDAWKRVQDRLAQEFTVLQSALGRHGHSAVGEPSDDGYAVAVEFGGRSTRVADLVEMLRADSEARERLLSARERTIIENHLVTEVGANLADLVVSAEGQVRALNEELGARPTSTGMKLRVSWRPQRDGPAGLVDARRRLLQIADAWSEEDRQVISAFLQARIKATRESDEAGTWYEHLEQALDYRAWHAFTVERYQNGAWRSAAGPASGGERVLAVSVPLFAAASSHYRTARLPHAARLITLDEAFAGVDDDSRAKSLGLLHAFDLDVVMTSEREWGCYPEVPGLSIAHLSRVEGIPAVLVSLWAWNGRVRTRVEPQPVASSEREPAAEGLWP